MAENATAAAAAARDREAVRALVDEILELENDRDIRQSMVESFDTLTDDPETYRDEKKEAILNLEAIQLVIRQKTQQKADLEQKIRASKDKSRSKGKHQPASASNASRDKMEFWAPSNTWPAHNGWEQSIPYRTSDDGGPSTSEATPRTFSGMPNFQLPLGAAGATMNQYPLGFQNNKRSHRADSFDMPSAQRNKSQRIHEPTEVIDLTGDDDGAVDLSRPQTQAQSPYGNAYASTSSSAWQPQSFGSGSTSVVPGQMGVDPFTSQYLGGFPGSLHSMYPNGSLNSSHVMPQYSHAPETSFQSAVDLSNPGTMPGSYLSSTDDEDYSSSSPFRSATDLLNGRLPRPNNNLSLTDAINRTRNFNFLDLTDECGNPLDRRVASTMQDINDDPRRSREEVEALLRNVHAGMAIPEEDREGTPDAMRYPLYAHQRVALTWMKRQEKGTNKGGILADDMGLGKTISVLALMVSNKPDRPSDNKTTLIVAPLSLIRQWEDEIKKKIKQSDELQVYVYHNQQKIEAQRLMGYDVVLTTYGTLVADWKKLHRFWKANGERQVNTKTDKALATAVSFFHPNYSMFYRVVLDESQMIKNPKAQSSMAVDALQSKYRWCLSGTPMMNGIDELFPLYRFLKIRPYNVMADFNRTFGTLFGRKGDAKASAMRNLQVLLKATLLRRTKTSEIDGKPILQLPEKTEEVVYAELDEEERKFYTDLEEKSQVQINKYLRKGTLGKHYSHVLVLLLRLRQSCCHPHLLLDLDDAAPPEVDNTMLERAKTVSHAVVARFLEKSRALANADAIDEGFECPICYDMMPDPMIPLPCGHELCAGCLKQHVENAKRENMRRGEDDGQVKCAVCRSPLDPQNAITFSAFKKVHMPDEVNTSSEDENSDGSVWSSDEDDDDEKEEEEDADKNGNLKGFVVDDNIYNKISDTEDDSSPHPEPKPKPAKSKGKGKKKAKPRRRGDDKKRLKKIKGSMLQSLRKEAKKNAVAWRDYMKYLSHHWLISAKVRACMDLVRKIQETGEKTIIFSQWTMLLDLLQVAIKKEGLGIDYCRYTGEMTMSQRDDSAFRFTSDPDKKVMLVSLRAGNAGLNLVAASNVVIMDPFWNPYIEMQAVDRAHRIGQQKPVKVYRILTQETVEDRIVKLQEKKRATVDAALDEREGAKLAGLSMTELRFLFNI
ncbi:SWI/SNF family DNA-dependent ATPase [Colletotrichum musicola]|uniref:SWI/SNF family DNA-dependent ATPase n=1 Tax=Colletotrichum musicola TaxID=2175873 RepID=A0A8H6JVA5_9PEZI|nr:SWI/SNF family DNA-dependent ATPase [Colletotrichum musicola]